MKLHWSHAVLYVRDLQKMIEFYRDVLGFQVSDRGSLDRDNPGAMEIAFLTQVGSDHHQLAFVPVRGEGPSTTLDHIAFRVDSLADVKEMASKLEADGRAGALRPINHGNAWSVYFADPEGNGLEVFCDSPFHVGQPQVTMWDPAMSEDELRRATEERFGAEAEFGPAEEFYAAHRRRHGD
jgi:catechol 2,3-dioxygenase